MKITIVELRDMIAEAVRRTVREGKKKVREIPQQSEESVLAQRDRHVRALPGYSHGNVLDMSKPLGKKNLLKRQGASGMGNWTSESAGILPEAPPGDENLQGVITVLQANGMEGTTAKRVADEIMKKMRHASVDPAEHGLDDPSELNIERRNEGVRALVRMIVDEEIKVSRGR